MYADTALTRFIRSEDGQKSLTDWFVPALSQVFPIRQVHVDPSRQDFHFIFSIIAFIDLLRYDPRTIHAYKC